MSGARRLRGLLGTTISWGAIGALVAAIGYIVRFQPWHLQVRYLERASTLFAVFIGSGALWGSVCGLAFGLVIMAAARHQRFEHLSSRKFVLWGALGGAAFPLMIYTPVVLLRGAYSIVPFYAMLTAISAGLGAIAGRAIFAMARRAPEQERSLAALAGAGFASDPTIELIAHEVVE